MTETLCPFVCGSINAPDLPLKLWQEELSGDFEISADFEEFVPSGYGAAFHAFVQDPSADEESADVSIAGASADFDLRVRITHGSTPQEEAARTSNSAGSLRIKRFAGFLTVTATAGSDERSISSAFSSNPLRVGVGIQGPYDPADPPATSHVHVANFSVIGGGGVIASDSFECNSIL